MPIGPQMRKIFDPKLNPKTHFAQHLDTLTNYHIRNLHIRKVLNKHDFLAKVCLWVAPFSHITPLPVIPQT